MVVVGFAAAKRTSRDGTNGVVRLVFPLYPPGFPTDSPFFAEIIRAPWGTVDCLVGQFALVCPGWWQPKHSPFARCSSNSASDSLFRVLCDAPLPFLVF